MKNKLVVRSRNVLKRNALRFAAALLVALASFVVAPNAAVTQAPQHHDQVPGFYRQKVGNLEVTALFDGHGVFDPHWLNGTKATMDGVVEALHEDPRLLDVSDEGFLVNTGKQLILVDAGAGTWWGGGALGRLLGSLRSAGYTPEEVDLVLVTHLHSDHVGGLTTDDGKRVFQRPMFTSRRPKATFGCRRKSLLRRRRMRNRSSGVRKPSQRRTSRPVSGTRLLAPSQSSTACNSSRCLVIHRDIPAMNFRQRDKKSCFGATSSMHSASSCSIPRSPRFSTSTKCGCGDAASIAARLAREHVLIAGPHMPFPALGSLRKEGSGYSWVPVVFTDQWVDK